MPRLMDPDLLRLSQLLSRMGDQATQSIELAVSSFLSGENTKTRVKELSDSITVLYDQVGDLTFRTLLKYQPVASDFRFMRSSIEISHSFYRFGRYAYDISLVRDKFGDISGCRTEWLSGVAFEILQMIRNAVDSFVVLDAEKAALVQRNEDYVDKLYGERISMLIGHSDTKCALAEALLLLYLERIGDHAVFMTRAVNYIVTGKHHVR